MGNLSDIAIINISAAAVGIKQASFNKIMIVDYHTRFSERVREYASTAAMLADGFTVNDAAYKAAGAAFAQTPQPATVKIGRRALAPDLQIDLIPTALDSTVYSVSLTGPTGLTALVSITSDGSATVPEIVTALTSAINTAALGITATNIGGSGTETHTRLKAASAGLWFGAKVTELSRLAVTQSHADAGIATDLAAIQLYDSDWYGMSLTTNGALEVIAAAVWVESNKKFYVQTTQEADSLTTVSSGLMYAIKLASEFRSKAMFAQDPRQFAAIAWMARVFAANPGATTFEFQRLAGINAELLTDSQLANLKLRRGSAVIDYGGAPMTVNSLTAGGEWMDVIRDRDWFEARTQNRIVTLKANASARLQKIPFTDPGAEMLGTEVIAQCAEGVRAGFLAADPAPVVVVPKVATVSGANRALRKFTPITFSATVAGAIHLTEISGTIS